ncbi:MAG: SDR family NAD(P)-dependent oxidoreductase [Immundisolibacterales bacterium]|nr:SDR family NAD(P)-dependent oxidoreductase [Immundisolibacterales bacterium]
MDRRVAIVTGGARGIGRGCAHALAERGLAVALVDVLAAEMANTKAEIEALGAPCLTFEADVAEHTRAKEVAAGVLAEWGRIDVLVNNAGRPMPVGILDISEEQWDATIDVNLKSCFNYIQAVAPAMLARGHGRIVSMSSLNAHSGGVTAAVSRFAYGAAKAGIIGMTRALAKELGPHIAVNCICPGLIKTELTSKNPVIAEREPELIEGIALRRTGSPRDVAELVAFLATAEPMFITGQDITIDGFQWNR